MRVFSSTQHLHVDCRLSAMGKYMLKIHIYIQMQYTLNIRADLYTNCIEITWNALALAGIILFHFILVCQTQF